VLLASALAALLVGGAWFGLRTVSGLRSPVQAAPRAASPAPSAPASVSLPAYSHVFLVMMENHGYDSIVGSRSAPYLNGDLIAHGAVAANYHGVAHPSLPNYVALQSGQTAGITTDCSPGPDCTANVPNLADRLEASGKSWKAYEESMPRPCTTDDSGAYAVRHDPFVYFDDVRGDAGRCASHVVPLTELGADLHSGHLPDFAFITPNVQDDMHDGTVAEGDSWLRGELPPLLGTPGSLVIVAWDEAEDGQSGNQVAAIFDGPGVAAGAVWRGDANHYSLLHTIEALEGVAPLTQADGQAAVMAGMFAGTGHA
jgi:acid phosphatase